MFAFKTLLSCSLLTIASFASATSIVASKRLQTFYSAWSQAYVLTQSGDYISPNTITIDNTSFNFECPGHSFLVGLESEYQSNARRFKFACNFLETPDGNPVFKKTATSATTGWDSNLYVAEQSKCTGSQFISGINAKSSISTASNTATMSDAQYRFICSTAVTSAQSNVATDTCLKPITLNNTFHGNTNMMLCPANTVIQQINSIFQVQGTDSDRIFTFTCCSLKY